MNHTKLILIEGLPGSGKTTTAQLTHEILTDLGIEAELFLEGNLDHPADYDGVSYFTDQKFEEVLSNHASYKQLLSGWAHKKNGGYLLPYQKMKEELAQDLPEELVRTIFSKDIYELPLDNHIELLTDKWREFTNTARKEGKTYIFECCFMQNPVTISLVKYNENKSIVKNYVKKLAEIIEPLHPLLIYVDQSSLENSFTRAFKERPKEWSEGFVDYYTNQGYGKAHQYKGFEGTLKVLETRKKVELEIMEELTIDKAKIDNTLYNKNNHQIKLHEILE